MPELKRGIEVPEQASPATPGAGKRLLYPKGNGKWYTKDSAGIETEVGGAVAPVQTAAPSNPVAGQLWYDNDEPTNPFLPEYADLRLTTDYVDTTPGSPATGTRLFTRHRARHLPAAVSPEGLDTQLQPAFFSNRIGRLSVVNNVATPQLEGLAVTNRATAPAAVAVASSSFFASMVRARYASIATAGNAGGFRSSSAQWFTSATANMGGLFMVWRGGINVGTATDRVFIGFSATNADLAAGSDPTTYLNCFGFAANAGHTNLRFIHNDGAGTATDEGALGNSFHSQTGATNFWELRIFIPSGLGNVVYWSAHRLSDGFVVQGGPITTDLPAVGTLLAFHTMLSNGTTASAVSMDVQSLYIETDN